MLTLGYLGAAVMGITLGLMGGGGSILTVPILVYLFMIPAASATYYSLFIVGVCAAFGVVPFARRGLVEFKTSFLFFFPALFGVLFSRRFILPRLPESKDVIILSAFALVMLAASLSMLRKKSSSGPKSEKQNSKSVVFSGIGVGLVTGFVGAGGGFLIVPALVNGVGLSMEKAVGTSLLIIALNSLSGFTGDLIMGSHVEWNLILPFLGTSLVGIFAGTYLNRYISSAKLKVAFGWFVLTIGSLMILKQIINLIQK